MFLMNPLHNEINLKLDTFKYFCINSKKIYLRSRNVFPLLKFFPIAVAFHAKYAPEGSHWNKYGLSLSQPHINKDTPNGRTPLE